MSPVLKFRKARTLAAVIAGVTVIVSGPAAHADYPAYVKSACKKDFKTFCPGYDIESNALRQCIRSVAKRLSPGCVDALERSGEKRR